MDSRVKVINKKIIAVDFNILPVRGIDYMPEYDVPIEDDGGRISDEGIMILNTKYKAYEWFKDHMVELIGLSDGKLLKRIRTLQKGKHDEVNDLMLKVINIEVLRREKYKSNRKGKAVKAIWQHLERRFKL